MPDPGLSNSAGAIRPRSATAVKWSGVTDRGRFRTNNEDVFLALAFNGHEVIHLGKTGESTLAQHDFVFAVSDGMGGARSGEFASRIAADRITRLLPRAFRLSAAGLASGFADILGELFEQIHRDMLRFGESYEECAGMGATLTLAWVTPDWIYFGHLGDSRLYHWQPGPPPILKQITHDDTHVGWLLRHGKLNERELRTHPRRNALQQALGAGHQFIEPHIGALNHLAGEKFLLCSDGVIDGLWDRQIGEILAQPPEENGASLAQHLVNEAVAHSGRDNATAVIVEIAGSSGSNNPDASPDHPAPPAP